MAEYVKVWNMVAGEEWYQSLSCLERGVWFQGLICSINAGGSGHFSCKNALTMSVLFSLDARTLARVIAKMSELGVWKVEISQNGVINIEVHNFMKWQEIGSLKEFKQKVKGEARDTQKCSKNVPTNELTNERTTKAERGGGLSENQRESKPKPSPLEPHQHFRAFCQSERNDSALRAIMHKYGLDEDTYNNLLEGMIDWMSKPHNQAKAKKIKSYVRFVDNWLRKEYGERIADGVY